MTDYAEPAASPSSPAVPSAPAGNDSGYDSGSPYNDDNSESNSGDSAYDRQAPSVVAQGALRIECAADQSKLIQTQEGEG